MALAYNPDLSPHRALVLLNQWIRRSPGLVDKLEALGYTKMQRVLTPAQASAIYDALGEP